MTIRVRLLNPLLEVVHEVLVTVPVQKDVVTFSGTRYLKDRYVETVDGVQTYDYVEETNLVLS
ncbi:MAG: hypothetical protein V4529_16930 [Gemmatimonadota bacterium]